MLATLELPLLIDGRQVAPLSNQTFDVVNPASEEVEMRAADPGPEVDPAVRAARGSFETRWRRVTPGGQGNLLNTINDWTPAVPDEGHRLSGIGADMGIAVES